MEAGCLEPRAASWAVPWQRAAQSSALPSCRTMSPSQWVQVTEHWAREDECWALRSCWVCLARFWVYLGSITLSFFSDSPFGNVCPVLSLYCILETHNLEWNGIGWNECIFQERRTWIWWAQGQNAIREYFYSYVEIIMPSMMLLEGGPFGRWLGHEGRALWVI